MEIMIKRDLYIVLIATTLLAGCNKVAMEPTDNNTSALLELNVGIGAVESRAAAVSGTQFARESQINVVLTDYNGGNTDYNNASGVYVYKDQTGTGGLWLPVDSEKPLLLKNQGAKVWAHYPAKLPSGASFNITAKTLTPANVETKAYGDLMAGEYNSDNSFWFSFKSGEAKREVFMADGETDYMYGSMTNTEAVTSVKKTAQIKMEHCLSIVVLHIFKSDNNTAPCNITKLTIRNTTSSTTLKSGVFSITTGALTAGTATKYIRTMNNFPISEELNFGMMLYPATIANGEVEVEIVADGQQYILPITACSWQSGFVNLYNIRLTPVSAELVDMVTVVDWGGGSDKEFDLN